MRLAVACACLAVLGVSPCRAKTPETCAAEYGATRDKIDGVQSQADFMAACEANGEVVPGPTSAAIPAVPPATAARQPPTPAGTSGSAPKPAVP